MLTGKQKSFLRGLAMTEEAIVQVGKAGVNESVLHSLEEALTARELVKVKVLKNCLDEVSEVAEALSQSSQSELVQVIGRNVLLYRHNSKKQNAIILPKEEKAKKKKSVYAAHSSTAHQAKSNKAAVKKGNDSRK